MNRSWVHLALPITLMCVGTDARSQSCAPAPGPPVQVLAIEGHKTLRLADGRRAQLAGIYSFSLLSGPEPRFDEDLALGLANLVVGQAVGLAPALPKRDRHGRDPAFVFVDGQLVQAALAGAGVAFHVPRPDIDGPCVTAIRTSEADARRAHRGHWQSPEMAVLPPDPSVLLPRIGHYVLVVGTVVSVGTRSRRTYLDFGRRWSEDFTVEIARGDRDKFGGSPALEALAGRRVIVRGFLESRGGPMIRATTAGQIEPLQD